MPPRAVCKIRPSGAVPNILMCVRSSGTRAGGWGGAGPIVGNDRLVTAPRLFLAPVRHPEVFGLQDIAWISGVCDVPSVIKGIPTARGAVRGDEDAAAWAQRVRLTLIGAS